MGSDYRGSQQGRGKRIPAASVAQRGKIVVAECEAVPCGRVAHDMLLPAPLLR